MLGFHEASLFRPWIMEVLNADLEQAKKHFVEAIDIRDWELAATSEAQIEYLEGLISKASDFHIIT